jgi:ADP-ribosylglycohydrolase
MVYLLLVPYKAYTDDAAMTMMVAESLVEKRGFYPDDMAKR